MKKFVAIGVLLAFCAGVAVPHMAFAAEKRAKAAKSRQAKAPSPPRPAVDPTPSWSGFYLGAGVGLRSVERGGSITNLTNNGVPSTNTANLPFNGTGFRGSLYLGYNFQLAPRWIVGLEGDVGWSDEEVRGSGLGFIGDDVSAKTPWDASLRGRLGYLITPSSLIYATGGVAWQRFENTGTCLTGPNSFCNGGIISTNSNVGTATGYTIGGGLETRVFGPWIARAEYRYSDFGSTSFLGSVTDTIGLPPSTGDVSVTMRTHTVTFGVAYKFGDPIASYPANTFAPMPVKWTGLYVGGGLGLRSTDADMDVTNISANGAPPTGQAITLPVGGTGLRYIAYLGHNWQIAPQWIAGLEGDFAGADHKVKANGTGLSAGDFITVKTDWDASIRGRIGYLVTPQILAYATGGVMWMNYDATGICPTTGSCNGGVTSIVTDSKTLTGWTLGGGLETMIAGPWIARAEYRYADFGTSRFSASILDTIGLPPSTADIAVHMKTHTVTFGLAYKFNAFGGMY